MASGNIEG
jgi:hypothetical protein